MLTISVTNLKLIYLVLFQYLSNFSIELEKNWIFEFSKSHIFKSLLLLGFNAKVRALQVTKM